MRIVIEFELIIEEKIKIFVDYRRKVISLFKSVLEKNNPSLKGKYYKGTEPKDFTFFCYFPIEKIENKIIFLKDNKIKIFLSTSKYEILFDFYNSFQEATKHELKFAGHNVKILSINLVNEKQITSEEVIFKIFSPVIIRDHEKETNKTWFYMLNDEEGIKILKRNLLETLKDKFVSEDIEKIEIEPINIKKVVSYYYNYKIQGSKGLVKIRAKKEILEYFYQVGFSSNKSAGFGYLDLV